jgi:hypothetical protein
LELAGYHWNGHGIINSSKENQESETNSLRIFPDVKIVQFIRIEF